MRDAELIPERQYVAELALTGMLHNTVLVCECDYRILSLKAWKLADEFLKYKDKRDITVDDFDKELKDMGFPKSHLI